MISQTSSSMQQQRAIQLDLLSSNCQQNFENRWTPNCEKQGVKKTETVPAANCMKLKKITCLNFTVMNFLLK